MACNWRRAKIRSHFDQVRRDGALLVIGGAGLGLSAKCEELGGADLLLFDSIGRYRMDGRDSLCGYFGYKNANEIVRRMADEMLGIVNQVPVIVGVSAADPFCHIPALIGSYTIKGCSGIANNPSVGCFEESELANLEKTDMGYAKEVEMIRYAHERDLFTVAFCWRETQAQAMAQAGADVIVIHLGICTGGMFSTTAAPEFEESVALARACVAAASAQGEHPYLFCHGGCLTEVATVERFLQQVPEICGFYGGEALERLPMERAIVETGMRYRSLRLITG